MPFTDAAKNTMLDALTPNRIRLHSGAPGDGTANALGAGLSTATFAAAASGERALASAVTVTGLTANQSITHFSVWNSTGPVLIGTAAITSGDATANASGEYRLAVGTKLDLQDPA